MRHYLNVRKTQVHISLVVALLAVLVCSVGYVIAQIFWTQNINGSVKVVGVYTVGVFADSAHTLPISQLNWTTIQLGSTTEVGSDIIYLFSSGSGPIIGKYLHVAVLGLPAHITLTHWTITDSGTNTYTPAQSKLLATSSPQLSLAITPDGSQTESTTAITVTFTINDVA
jgi:hypothetical protein